jgi:TPR repeat protein
MGKGKKLRLGPTFIIICTALFLVIAPIAWFFFQTSSTGDPQKDLELYWKYRPFRVVDFEEIKFAIKSGYGDKFLTTKRYFSDRWNLQKALRYLKSAAEKGHADAQYYLALHYYRGAGVSKNIEKANEWLIKSADNGSPMGLHELGCLYLKGRVFPKDHKKAIELLKKAVAQGSAEAEYDFCLMHHYGKILRKDDKKAFEWAMKAADKNHSEAKDYLGMAYTRGWGVERNYQKAVEWFEKSVDNYYNSQAMCDLAFMKYNGLGCKKDYKEVLKLVDKLDARRDLGGILLLARLYREGKAIPKNLERAERLYREVLKMEPEWGYNGLAYMWAEEGIKLDEAEKMAKEALKLKPDNTFILDTLAWVYYKQKRYKEAVKLLEKSVESEALIENLDHLGDAYFALGEKEKAKEQWKNSHKLCHGYYLSEKIEAKLK